MQAIAHFRHFARALEKSRLKELIPPCDDPHAVANATKRILDDLRDIIRPRSASTGLYGASASLPPSFPQPQCSPNLYSSPRIRNNLLYSLKAIAPL